jgi:GNAT superfamily N-acetyltransferase
MESVRIVWATEEDSSTILALIRELAEYEKLADMVVADEAGIRSSLFGANPAAEVLLAYDGDACVGFALFFRTYSTFLAKPGIYLEDLYVRPAARGKRIGFRLLVRLAQLARERNCGRLEWAVLDWNEPSIQFYRKLGAIPKDEWITYQLAGEALAQLAAQRC